ncbi:hypothetical protein HMPREF9554_00628 [Treponema phagedenis F0421]|nr:hypothetical protein HMPREF9554_00628 [Treponema phagedenis F0421]
MHKNGNLTLSIWAARKTAKPMPQASYDKSHRHQTMFKSISSELYFMQTLKKFL